MQSTGVKINIIFLFIFVRKGLFAYRLKFTYFTEKRFCCFGSLFFFIIIIICALLIQFVFLYEVVFGWYRQGEIKALTGEVNQPQRNFAHHKSDTDRPESSFLSPRFSTKPELYVKTVLEPRSKHTQLQISIRYREFTPVFFSEIHKICIHCIGGNQI